MKIDTSYAQAEGVEHKMTVSLTLDTDEERALADDLLARIGANQHMLDWEDGDDGIVRLTADPAMLRLPLSHRHYTVTRDGDTARVEYREERQSDAAKIVYALAASLAVAFGSISELRYNDIMLPGPQRGDILSINFTTDT